MSDASASRAAVVWLQLVAAFGCVFVMQAASFQLGATLLLLMAAVWRPSVPYQPVRPFAVLKVYLPAAPVWAVLATAYLWSASALGVAVEPQEQLLVFAELGWSTEILSMLLLPVVAAPFFEELLFRGYLFGALETVLPMWGVQVAVAVLFGLAHGLDHALPIGVLSLVFGYLRMRHRSLYPSMLAHMLHNAITIAVVVQWPGLLDLFYAR